MDERDYIAMNKEIKESTMKDKAEFAVKILLEYAKENGINGRDTTDLSPLETWLILRLFSVSCSFSKEELEKKAVEFYEFWYDKYGTSEIDEIERKPVIHAFLGGCKYVLENCN